MTATRQAGCGTYAAGCLLLLVAPLLIAGIASAWVKARHPEWNPPRDLGQYSSLEISEFTHITAAEIQSVADPGFRAADEFRDRSLSSRFSGNIRLNGLTTIESEVASSLVTHHSPAALTFRNVHMLGDGVAAILATHDGDLYLDGLEVMPDSVAEALSHHQGHALSLLGLKEATPSQIATLKKHKGPLMLPAPSERPQ